VAHLSLSEMNVTWQQKVSAVKKISMESSRISLASEMLDRS